ncbi:MAG: ribokinase [Flexilinea sp.]|nr:ribokinase [Flexilinea sp.]
MKTLCFGSLNIDNVYDVPHFVARGETLAASELNIFSGGKGLNQSIALSRAGLEVFHAGTIGTDGQFLLDELKAAGVDTRYTAVLDDTKTGHAIIQKAPDGDNCILLFGGANQQITREQIDRTLANFGEGDLLVVQNEISELHYLVSAARSRGMLTALNPSPMEYSLLPLLSQVDYLILNEIEAAQFLKLAEAGDPDEMLDALIRLFPSVTIVLTLGSDGSVYAKGAERIRQAAIPVQAVDTTAAGDTFTGYLLAGLLTGGDPATALKYAATAAAIAVTRPGAAPSIPTKEEVENY